MRRWWLGMGVLAMALAGTRASWAVMGHCDVKSMGAKGDGVTDDTAAIQRALDTCRSNKAPYAIVFGPGVYVSGPLVSQGFEPSQGQWFVLDKGAVLRASTRRSAWKLGSNGYGVEPLLLIHAGSLRLMGGGVIQSVGLKWEPSRMGANGKGLDAPDLSRPVGMAVRGGFVTVEDVRFE